MSYCKILITYCINWEVPKKPRLALLTLNSSAVLHHLLLPRLSTQTGFIRFKLLCKLGNNRFRFNVKTFNSNRIIMKINECFDVPNRMVGVRMFGDNN